MKNALEVFLKILSVILKLCLTVIIVAISTLAASPFMLVIWGFGFVYPLGQIGETIALMVIFALYALGFALGVYWAKGIWR